MSNRLQSTSLDLKNKFKKQRSSERVALRAFIQNLHSSFQTTEQDLKWEFLKQHRYELDES